MTERMSDEEFEKFNLLDKDFKEAMECCLRQAEAIEKLEKENTKLRLSRETLRNFYLKFRKRQKKLENTIVYMASGEEKP